MITQRGSFIINGAERVIVSQLHRSPGICFEEACLSGKILHSFHHLFLTGTWTEVQFDQNDLLYVYLDRRRHRRKFLLSTLFRALGYLHPTRHVEMFYKIEDVEIDPATSDGKHLAVCLSR